MDKDMMDLEAYKKAVGDDEIAVVRYKGFCEGLESARRDSNIIREVAGEKRHLRLRCVEVAAKLLGGSDNPRSGDVADFARRLYEFVEKGS